MGPQSTAAFDNSDFGSLLLFLVKLCSPLRPAVPSLMQRLTLPSVAPPTCAPCARSAMWLGSVGSTGVQCHSAPCGGQQAAGRRAACVRSALIPGRRLSRRVSCSRRLFRVKTA